jgi:hypothetical protein
MVGCGVHRRAAAALGLGIVVLLGATAGSAGAGAVGHRTMPRTAAPRHAALGDSRRTLAMRYLAIAEAGNHRLEKDFDPLEARDRNNLARARADLRDAAATERLFDRRLLRISFPPAIERVARDLYRVNQWRATLTAAAAAATSLAALHSYEPVLDAANAPVERAVKTIRRQLGLPPPETS